MIRIAFPLIGGAAWTGGYVYLKNTLGQIRSRLSDSIEASVFLSPAENEAFGDELAELVDGRMHIDPRQQPAGKGPRLVEAMVSGGDSGLSQLLGRGGIDVVFENARFYGARFPIPVVSWIPDLQHRIMPQMFTAARRWRRDIGFRMQLNAKRTVIVSSEAARDDLRQFYGTAPDRIHVVRFAAQVDVASCLERVETVRAFYELPERFFYLPNQFWRHKNHELILRALILLKESGRLQDLPPVALSGAPKGQFGTQDFDRLFAEARANGVDSHFRYLGLLPHDHVLALNAASTMVINPSLVEGWATALEEAKALGTPLLLSDITIHREQAPNASFFNPQSVERAADALLEAATQVDTRVRSVKELLAEQDRRAQEHAHSLLKAIRAAAGRNS